MALLTQDMLNRCRLTEAPIIVDLSTTTARSTLLPVGVYEVTASADCFVRQGASVVEAAATDHAFWAKGAPRRIFVESADDGYVAGIVAAATAKLYISPLR